MEVEEEFFDILFDPTLSISERGYEFDKLVKRVDLAGKTIKFELFEYSIVHKVKLKFGVETDQMECSILVNNNLFKLSNPTEYWFLGFLEYVEFSISSYLIWTSNGHLLQICEFNGGFSVEELKIDYTKKKLNNRVWDKFTGAKKQIARLESENAILRSERNEWIEKAKMLSKELEEERFRPPELGGSGFEQAKTHFVSLLI